MEISPTVELISRKVDIKPEFHLKFPQVSKEMATSFLKIEKKGVSDPEAKELLEKERIRIEKLFDDVGGGNQKGLRERLISTIDDKLKSKETTHEDKKDLLSDKNYINSLFNKVDSWRDSLTGLYNRRGFSEIMRMIVDTPEEIFGENHKEITNRGFSLIMMDIDFFKNINDKLGHEEGDRALVGFSRSVGESVRSTDVVVRFGGEEVLIVAFATDLGDAAVVDAKIAGRVSKIELGSNGEGIHFTYSAGVDNQKTWGDLAEMANSKDPMALSLLLHDADAALHKAKDEGRNRIKFSGEQT